VIGKSGNTGYSQCIPHLHVARQYQGAGVTQSVPVYFEGYAGQELHSGDAVSVPAAPCALPADDGATSQPKAAGNVRSGSQLEHGTFCGVYYGGDLNQPQAFIRRDSALNFDWRAKGPGGYWLEDAASAFGARWSGDFAFYSAGRYSIAVRWSGAVRVSIDGDLVVDRWVNQDQPAPVVITQALGAGVHRVDVEYLAANGHGMLYVGWGRMSPEVSAAD
jgi:hypothetical protein